MTGQPPYPYRDGDRAVLGPDVTATADGETITWQGAVYRRDRGDAGQPPEPRTAATEASSITEPCDDCLRGKHGPNAHRQGIDPERARQQLTAVRNLRNDLRGITGARWIAYALDNILNQPAAPCTGPSVAECAADDRAWWSGGKASE